MPTIVLRAVPDDPSEDGRELARATILTHDVQEILDLVNRAIGYGHELSYVEVEGEPCAICGEYPQPNGLTYHLFHPNPAQT